MKTLVHLLLACGCLVAANCSGGTIYEFVDYPDLQNGYTLSGTIEVADTAADDGLLAVEEILDWSWVADGPVPYSGGLRPDFNLAPTPTWASRVEIDSLGVYLPAMGQSWLAFDYAFIDDLPEVRNLLWDISDRRLRYRLGGLSFDVGFDVWNSTIPVTASRNRWQIARRVPELSTAASLAWSLVMANSIRRSRRGMEKHNANSQSIAL